MAEDLQSLLSHSSPVDVQATFCATVVDEWIQRGVRHAVVAPGSRSTPLALAIADRDELALHVVHDERVAAFIALGLGVSAKAPAVLLCTSGTAAANFFPAVVEAGLSAIPMLVLTADRPDELRGVGAPQTIDQIELYGSHVRWFCDPGVPDAASAWGWRPLAAEAHGHAAAGPVQLNLAFREPLVGTAVGLPTPVEDADDTAPVPVLESVPTPAPASGAEASSTVLAGIVGVERGLILAGGASGVDDDSVVALRDVTGWPLVADPLSGLRARSDVTAVDSLLRVDGFADRFLPDVVVRIGRPSTSKMLAQWTARPEPVVVQVGGPGRIDPAGNVAAVASIDELLATVEGHESGHRSWLDRWRRIDADAGVAIVDALGDELSEPLVARTLMDRIPPGAQVTVSSSMPVRDVEWYGGRTPHVHANRGANGIDGVLSTAVGRALELRRPQPAFVLIGDLAFVHDSNAFVGLVDRGVDLRVVVIDNDGGGIFSFLPQQRLLAHDRFEKLFGTPLGSDVLALAAAHGVAVAEASNVDELIDQIDRPGPWVCRVRTDRSANVTAHERLHAAVAAAISPL